MEVIRAKSAGFCFGENALSIQYMSRSKNKRENRSILMVRSSIMKRSCGIWSRRV